MLFGRSSNPLARFKRRENEEEHHGKGCKKRGLSTNLHKHSQTTDSTAISTVKDDGSCSSSEDLHTAGTNSSGWEYDDKNSNKANGGVQFELSRNEFIEDTLRDMDSEEEWNAQWYRPDTIRSYRQDQVLTAGNLFENTFRLAPEDAQAAEKWKIVLREAYKECCDENQIYTEEEEEKQKSNLENQQPAEEQGQSTEAASPGPPNEALVELYRCESASEMLVGMETNMLARFRGKAKRNCRYILEQIQILRTTTTTEEPAFFSSSSISSVTEPSLAFAHRLAVAQAEALARDDQEEE